MMSLEPAVASDNPVTAMRPGARLRQLAATDSSRCTPAVRHEDEGFRLGEVIACTDAIGKGRPEAAVRLTQEQTLIRAPKARRHAHSGTCSSASLPAGRNHKSRIAASSLLGFGFTSRTLNVVGKLTALPKIRACCFGNDGRRFITLSETNGVICRIC